MKAWRGMALCLVVLLSAAAWCGDVPAVNVIGEGGSPRRNEAVRQKALRDLNKLRDRFGLEIPEKLTVVLADSEAAFRRAQPDGSRVPDWAAGVAWPELGLIVVKTPSALPGSDLEHVLEHELAHLALRRVFGRKELPLWLNEGLTMHLSDDWGVSRQIAMTRALVAGGLIRLDRLVHAFPESRIAAETAYAQSYYLVAFIRERGGKEAMSLLIRGLAAGVDPERAIHQATGLYGPDLETEFHEWLKKRFTGVWLILDPWFLWFAGALLLVIAGWRKYRAGVRKKAEWEDEADGTEDDAGGSGGPGPSAGDDGPVRTAGRRRGRRSLRAFQTPGRRRLARRSSPEPRRTDRRPDP